MVTTGGYRFFADENILGVGKALAMLRRDVLHPGHPALPEVPLGSPDSVWIPLVAARGLVAFSRDKRMRTRPAERAAIAAAGLRGVWIADKRDLSNWDLMVRLTRYWNDIEHAVVVHPAGPWLGSLTTRGLRIQFP